MHRQAPLGQLDEGKRRTRASRPAASRPSGRAVRHAAIAALALTTGYAHATLGGTLFLLNAGAYATLAVGLLLFRTRAPAAATVTLMALLGVASVTLTGWLLTGPRYPFAYAVKLIETCLVLLVLVDLRLGWRPRRRLLHGRTW